MFPARLELKLDNGQDTYTLRLFHAAGDRLIFAEETLSFLEPGFSTLKLIALGAGHEETRIGQEAEKGEPTAKVFRHLLNRCRVYHFHDTPPTARVRQASYVGDIRWLMPDAGNLAALLLHLRNEPDQGVYQRIVSTIRLIAPFFDDFDLRPNGPGQRDVFLNWRNRGSDQVFGPHQLSGGTLRAFEALEQRFAEDIDDPRFVPYIQLHERLEELAAGTAPAP